MDAGEGIVDDWSGASLLPSLYPTLKMKEGRKHTYEFVAFTAEERGLIGSNRFVRDLSAEEKSNIKAFINLECLGLKSPNVWIHRSAPILTQLLAQVANDLRISLEGVNV